VTPLFVT